MNIFKYLYVINCVAWGQEGRWEFKTKKAQKPGLKHCQEPGQDMTDRIRTEHTPT